MVSRAFVHAYRIMNLIIEQDGHNHWLVDGAPHCNVRRDFVDTKHGIKPRTIEAIIDMYLIPLFQHRTGQTATFIMFFWVFPLVLPFFHHY
jgi:hypothetical protein